MDEQINIGEKTQRLREESKITQKQISLYLGVDQSMISKIENNERKPNIEMLDKLSVLFGCSSDYFNSDNACKPHLQIAYRPSEVCPEDFQVISAINRIALNLHEMKQMLGDDRIESKNSDQF